MSVIITIIVFFILMNIVGFALMAIDKWRAVHKEWRIPEKVLLGMAILGGSIGVFAGMHLCRHKTKKRLFVYGVPTILVIQCVLILYEIFSGKFTIMW